MGSQENLVKPNEDPDEAQRGSSNLFCLARAVADLRGSLFRKTQPPLRTRLQLFGNVVDFERPPRIFDRFLEGLMRNLRARMSLSNHRVCKHPIASNRFPSRLERSSFRRESDRVT